MARSIKGPDLILCYDLGGTKLRAALVHSNGKLLTSVTEKIDQAAGLKGLVALFIELRDRLDAKGFRCVSVASAGPLHAESGVLLDPTNFFTDKKSWGVVPLVRELKKAFKKPVHLENDAACAALGEQWKGGHGVKASRNLVAMTLGTGVGIGVIANGQLVRAGRGLHPEFSHIPINAEDKSHPCGCGAFGCIEAFLGGSHFTRRLSVRLGQPVKGSDAVKLALAGDRRVLAGFQEYGRYLAIAVRSLSVTFAPEVIVLSGGFSHAADLYLPEAEKVLPSLMTRYRVGIDLLPKLKVSKLQLDAGILGAAKNVCMTFL